MQKGILLSMKVDACISSAVSRREGPLWMTLTMLLVTQPILTLLLYCSSKHFNTISQIQKMSKKEKTETLYDTVKIPRDFKILLLHDRLSIYLISHLDSESLNQNENGHFASQESPSFLRWPIIKLSFSSLKQRKRIWKSSFLHLIYP